MPVYLVRIRCDSIRANLEGAPCEYSFLKNEFVRAPNVDLAAEKAFANVRDALSTHSSIEKEDAASATLVVDEIRENESFFRLFEKHGFVFAPPLQPDEISN
jgi:hypothetical protein